MECGWHSYGFCDLKHIVPVQSLQQQGQLRCSFLCQQPSKLWRQSMWRWPGQWMKGPTSLQESGQHMSPTSLRASLQDWQWHMRMGSSTPQVSLFAIDADSQLTAVCSGVILRRYQGIIHRLSVLHCQRN